MGIFRDHRYSEVRRYYVSNQNEWGRRHGIRRYRTKADALEQLIVAAITSWVADPKRTREVLIKIGLYGTKLNQLCGAGPKLAKCLTEGSPRYVHCALKALVERIEVSCTSMKIFARAVELPRLLA
jgi:hypothetical protein